MTAKKSHSAAGAARALCAFLERVAGPLAGQTAWEPACGDGRLAGPLADAFGTVIGAASGGGPCDWIIMSPPEEKAEACARAALGRARVGVALLVPTAFLAGNARFAALFAPQPPAFILLVAELLTLTGDARPAACCWIVWSADMGRLGTWFRWLPPGRTRPDRHGEEAA